MSKNKLAHAVWECKYHIVLVPKYRYKVFEKEIREAVRDELKKLCLWLQVVIIEGNVCKVHIPINSATDSENILPPVAFMKLISYHNIR